MRRTRPVEPNNVGRIDFIRCDIIEKRAKGKHGVIGSVTAGDGVPGKSEIRRSKSERNPKAELKDL